MFFSISVNKNKREKKKSRFLIPLMFVFLIIITLCAFLFTRLYCVPEKTEVSPFGEIDLSADTQGDREAFFEQFSTTAESFMSCEVTLPEAGEEFEKYRELQESQGFDISPFAGKSATQYVLKLSEKSENGYPLYGVMTVYGGKVIAVHLTDYVYPSEYLPLSYLRQ